MRKIIANLALSLDGFIEGPNGEYDWCFTDEDYGFTEFLSRIDSLLIGRKSYETLSASGPDPFADKHKYVVSNTLKSTAANESILSGDFRTAIHGLKKAAGKDIWLFGGAQLTEALLAEKLIDEFHLAIHPLLLVSGKKLFPTLLNRLKLELFDCRKFDSGLVQLFYTVKY